MKCAIAMLFVASASALNAFGQGTILWDESVNGPLSEDYTHPTAFGILSQGTNSVIGSVSTEVTGNNYAAHDDYFTFTVGGGNSLSGVYIRVDNPTLVWIGNPSFSSMIGQVFNPTNGELLTQMAIGPLGSGTFGMYLSNNEFGSSTSISNYRLDFFVQTVPEPGAVCLFLLGAGVFGFFRWKNLR